MRAQQPTRVGQTMYISHPMEVSMKAYSWGETNWRCQRCSAEWSVADVTHASLSVHEIATHAGGQTFWRDEGLAGNCACGVLWTTRVL